MRYLLSIIFFILCTTSLKAQSLDYARDVFFNEQPLKQIKDYYYENSPLLAVMQGYGGKGLNIVVVCPESTPITIAKKNIELELSFEMNRPYLSNLNILYSAEKLREFLKTNQVDFIIIEESFVLELSDIRKKYLNATMVFNSDFKVIRNPNPVDHVRPWWHYNFRMNSISKELIKVWRSQEEYRTSILFIERSKNFSISIHKRISVMILILLLVVIVFSGFYQRAKHKKKFVYVMTFILLFLSISGLIKLKSYHEFVNGVNQFKLINYKSIDQIIGTMDSIDPLIKVVALRSITERLIYDKEEEQFKQNLMLLTEKLKVLLKHEDERVRMWSLAVISKSKDENLINFVAGEPWFKDESYLVRTRFVRVLASLQNLNTDRALIEMAKMEKHPYVYTEIRDVCLERNIWQQGETIEHVQ